MEAGMKNLKRNLLVAILAIVSILCVAFAAGCSAPKGSLIGLKFSEYDDHYVVYGIGSTRDTDIIIPSEYGNKPVTKIAAFSFERRHDLTSVKIPESVTEIDELAFRNCSVLTIYCEAKSKPEGWEENWNEGCPVVWDCKNNDVAEDGYIYTYIDGIRYALKDGEATVVTQSNSISVNVAIPKTVKYKKNSYTVTAIGDNAFDIQTNVNTLRVYIETITLPDSITTIGNYAFYETYWLSDFTIPSGVISIGDYAFSHCLKMESITIPESVKSIGVGTFEWSGLKRVTISSNITQIPEKAFASCIALNNVTIPNGVTSIGDGAFSFCSDLTSITIPDKVTSIGDAAFYCCGFTSITLPDGITSIGDNMFNGCRGLTSITIPKGVTSIGNSVFFECDALEDVYFGGTADEWDKITIGYNNSNLTDATIHYN